MAENADRRTVLVTGASGFLGGKLAYTFGVRVAREPDQAEGYRRAG